MFELPYLIFEVTAAATIALLVYLIYREHDRHKPLK